MTKNETIRARKEASAEARRLNIYNDLETAKDLKQSKIKQAENAIGNLVHAFHDPYSYVDNHGVEIVRSRFGYTQAEVAGGIAYALRNLADQTANSSLPKAIDKVKALQQSLNHNTVDALERAMDYVDQLNEQLAMLEALAAEAERVYDTEVDPVARERRDDRIMKATEKRNAAPIDDKQLRALSERAARITGSVTAADDVNSVH